MKIIANFAVDVGQSANLAPKRAMSMHRAALASAVTVRMMLGFLVSWGSLAAHGQGAANTQAPTASTAVAAVVEVSGAWVRPTVPGQKGTGGFLTLTSKTGAKLMSISSPVAGVSEVHEMAMEGGVMKMRALPYLDLPAGQAVELKPGGNHLMLMDLKQALPLGSEVPVTLVFKDKNGKELRQTVKIAVARSAMGASIAPTAGAASAALDHSAHKH